METVMLTIKSAVFLAMDAFVFAVMGVALIVGVYQIVRDNVRRTTEMPVGRTGLPTRAR